MSTDPSRRIVSWISTAIALSSGIAAVAVAEDVPESRISVPVLIDLPGLAAYADGRLPSILHSNEYGRTCVEPERVCTKVPEFRGFEVTMKNRCAEVSPRIDCTVTETVTREGPIQLSGNGGQIVVQQNIFGSGTVRGRGEIGRHIRQTVRARAEMTILASPGVTPDWQPVLPISISYKWLERPEFRLFNLIPVTLGSTLGPPLDQALRQFESKRVGEELEKVDLRSEAEALWTDIQKPQALELPGGEALYLHMRPTAVGLVGPSFNDGALQARIDLALHAVVSDTPEGIEVKPLPDISTLSDVGLALNVPVRVSTDTINTAVVAWLPATITLDEEEAGQRIVIHQAITSVDDDALTVDLVVDAKGGILELADEAVRIQAMPSLDDERGSLVFSDIRLASGEGGIEGHAKTLMLKAMGLFMADTYSIALNDELHGLEKALDEALNRDLTPELRLVGNGQMRVSNIRLLAENSEIEATLSSAGVVQIIGFDPRRAQ